MDLSNKLELTFEISVDDDLDENDVLKLPYVIAHDQIVKWNVKTVKLKKTYGSQKFSLWSVVVTVVLDTEFDSDAVEYFISFYQATLDHPAAHYIQLLTTELV
jgi:hypothetical protein